MNVDARYQTMEAEIKAGASAEALVTKLEELKIANFQLTIEQARQVEMYKVQSVTLAKQAAEQEAAAAERIKIIQMQDTVSNQMRQKELLAQQAAAAELVKI